MVFFSFTLLAIQLSVKLSFQQVEHQASSNLLLTFEDSISITVAKFKEQ